MSEEQSSTPLKKPKGGEKWIEVLRSGLELVPGVSFFFKVLDIIIPPPTERRNAQWWERLDTELETLTQKVEGLTPVALAENDTFITVLLHAAPIALRNHQREKLDALHNAVLNAAILDAPDEMLQMMFLRWIDDFTPWHLKVLAFLHDPSSWLGFQRGARGRIAVETGDEILAHFPEMKEHPELYKQVIRDLRNNGLYDGSSGSGQLISRPDQSKTTELGAQFLQYISSPLENDADS